MRTKILYVCEICGREFTDEESAKSCESQHHIPTKIVKYRFNSAITTFPSIIKVASDDGTTAQYAWTGIVNGEKVKV